MKTKDDIDGARALLISAMQGATLHKQARLFDFSAALQWVAEEGGRDLQQILDEEKERR